MAGKLRAGRVLGQGFRAWGRRFARIHLVMLGLLLPLIVVGAFIDSGDLPVPEWSGFAYWGSYFFSNFLALELYSVLWFGGPAFEGDRGTNGSAALLGFLILATQMVASAFIVTILLTGGRRRAPLASMVGHAALLAFVTLAVQTVLTTLSVGIGWEWGSDTGAVALMSVGVILLWLASALCLALPAIAVEGIGVWAAFRRSLKLATGSRFRVGAIVLLLQLLHWIVIFTAQIVSVRAFPHFGAAVLFGSLLATLKTTVLTAAYDDLCFLKEGPRPEVLETVFE